MRGGALLGGLIAVVALGLYATHFSRWHSPTTQALFLTAAMGGAGAIISVMSRMARQGRLLGRSRGRPEDGAQARQPAAVHRRHVRGRAVLRLREQLVQLGTEKKTIYFYAIVSFLAGFSERWARLMLHKSGADEPPSPSKRSRPRSSSPTRSARARS